MQLKKDTDYALQILWLLNKHKETSLRVSYICKNTNIPITKVKRICDALAAKKIIDKATVPFMTYGVNSDTETIDLFKVIDAIEGAVDLFAVFDKKTPFYKSSKHELDNINLRCIKDLEKINFPGK